MNITITTGSIDEVLSIDAQIPEFDGQTTKHSLQQRLTNKDSLILIAYANGKPIGYKLGYAKSKTAFYSWLGGVIPSHRKQGIATKLRQFQESWAIDNHYASINVKSMNRFPTMLQMLISSGYQICGYQDNGNEQNSKIRFIKYLN